MTPIQEIVAKIIKEKAEALKELMKKKREQEKK